MISRALKQEYLPQERQILITVVPTPSVSSRKFQLMVELRDRSYNEIVLFGGELWEHGQR